MKLLYRGKKYLDESFPDYVARLAYWNDFRTTALFVSKLRKIYQGLYVGAESEEVVRRKHPNEKWYECRVALEFILERYFFYSQLNLSNTIIRKYKIEDKICPLCWKEKPYIRFYWRDRFYAECHKHDVLLQRIKDGDYRAIMDGGESNFIFTQKHRYSNCSVTKNYLMSRGEKGITLNGLYREKKNNEKESLLWQRVIRFLETKFAVEFAFNDVSKLYDQADLAGLPFTTRIERVRELIIQSGYENKKLLTIVIVIYLEKYHMISSWSEEMNWLLSECYSVHPVFYAYINGVEKHLFAKDDERKGSELRGIIFYNFSDRSICKFILESSILSPRELDELDHSGKNYSAGWSEAFGQIGGSSYDLKGYLNAAGENVFDRRPLSRMALD